MAAIDFHQPASRDAVIAAFGNGHGVLVLGGGTIVTPLLARGHLEAKRVLSLAEAGLDYIRGTNGTLTIGAATPLARLSNAPEPLGSCVRGIADFEIRSQGTVAGNLCAQATNSFSGGDLQGPLLAFDAQVTSVGIGGERTESVEAFLANPSSRLVLEIEVSVAADRGAFAALRRPHAHHYTTLAVSAVVSSSQLRVVATGVANSAVRLAGVESSRDSSRAAEGLEFREDALASAWYRRQTLPVLTQRALDELEVRE
jgi:CO/xanthine dehydrogenase FAD-binding subunit